nr:hypothetical protein [Methylocystis sp. WRRC1]
MPNAFDKIANAGFNAEFRGVAFETTGKIPRRPKLDLKGAPFHYST